MDSPPAPAADSAPAATSDSPAAGDGSAARGQRPDRRDRGAQGERPRRRRRLTAAEKHRRTFFAKLTELRKQEQAAVEANEPEPEQPAAEAPAEGEAAPAAAEAEAQPQQQQQPAAPPATSPSRSARAQARLVAAIERVGGAEAVREALQPKRRDDGETMKWSSVCAEQAQGVKPGDPIFTAWVRLAATPVRDVKAIVNPRTRDDDRRGRGRGRRQGGGGGGGGGYRGDRGDRGDRDSGRPARREELETHGRDGSFRSSVRIVHVDSEGQRKDRDDERRAERDAKRQAEAERLAKLGY